MLVLRRRPNEAIVFEGGLVCAIVEVADALVWLAIEAPDQSAAIEIGLSSPAPSERLRLGLRGAKSQERKGKLTSIEVFDARPFDPDTVLLLDRGAGEAVRVGEIELRVEGLAPEGPHVRLVAPGLAAPVALRIVSLSPIDARIGVDAPPEIRVFRKEVWDQLQAANTSAAEAWSPEDLAALTPERPD